MMHTRLLVVPQGSDVLDEDYFRSGSMGEEVK